MLLRHICRYVTALVSSSDPPRPRSPTHQSELARSVWLQTRGYRAQLHPVRGGGQQRLPRWAAARRPSGGHRGPGRDQPQHTSIDRSRSDPQDGAAEHRGGVAAETGEAHNRPPEMEDTSKQNQTCFALSQIDINPGLDGRFGFTIIGDSPLMVENCVPNGPAGNGGLKVGDYVMEVNGIPVKHHEAAAAMIKAAQGRPLRLGVLSMARRPKRLSSSMRVLSQTGDSVRDSRAHKAMEFNKKVRAEQIRYLQNALDFSPFLPFYSPVRWRKCSGKSQM